MSQQLSSDEITRLCQELVYQVAYAFYDVPYIIILKLLVQDNVTTEMALAAKIGLTAGEVRKYMGTLHLHRLVRRHVNKEKVQMPEWRLRQLAQQQSRQQNQSSSSKSATTGPLDTNGNAPKIIENRTRDVIYWYLDYREFANVVKYRLAMMRKGIDDKIKQEVGHRGYICPNDGTTYDPLDLSHLFDPFTNSFKCELCQGELIEHDPSLDNDMSSSSKDAMQRFNIATAPIRDVLKAVEAVTVPSVNIIAWIAVNVKTTAAVDGQTDGEEKKKFEIVIGEEDGEEEKEKLAKAQREQNALPVWHTHSTVTGSATTLGMEDQRRREANPASGRGKKISDSTMTREDEVLAMHYENLDDEDDDNVEEVQEVNAVSGTSRPQVQFNLDVQDQDDEDEDDGEGLEDITPLPESSGAGGKSVTVFVNGQPKSLEDVTEEDHDLMTTEEYEAYAQAMYG